MPSMASSPSFNDTRTQYQNANYHLEFKDEDNDWLIITKNNNWFVLCLLSNYSILFDCCLLFHFIWIPWWPLDSFQTGTKTDSHEPASLWLDTNGKIIFLTWYNLCSVHRDSLLWFIFKLLIFHNFCIHIDFDLNYIIVQPVTHINCYPSNPTRYWF